MNINIILVLIEKLSKTNNFHNEKCKPIFCPCMKDCINFI